MSATKSFARFTIGFLTFVSVSLAITVFTTAYVKQQDNAKRSAAAVQAMVVQK